MMRKQIAAANWKMNLNAKSAAELVDSLLMNSPEVKDNHLVILGAPSLFLEDVNRQVQNNDKFFVAAQDCSANKDGAYTGEISAKMLAASGIKYVIIGHSERRQYHAESNSLIAEKINRALEEGIIPIFCCGEPLNIRDANKQNIYVEEQLKESLFHLSEENFKKIIVAYEPIWAIGTGKTATEGQAQEIHHHIRNVISEKYGKHISDNTSILYGGSVKGNNAKLIFGQKDVDGGLVGGASLKADEFIKIIEGLK